VKRLISSLFIIVLICSIGTAQNNSKARSPEAGNAFNAGLDLAKKGDFKAALVWAERTVKQDPEYIIGNVHLCSVYYLLGREEDAHLQAKKVLKLNPNFSLKKLERILPYKNPVVKKQYIDALRNAGLPD